MRGEFPETLFIEQEVVLSCRFAEWKVRRAPRVLRMAVVSQSSVKFGKKRVFLVGTINFMTITAEVATSKFVFQRREGKRYQAEHKLRSKSQWSAGFVQ